MVRIQMASPTMGKNRTYTNPRNGPTMAGMTTGTLERQEFQDIKPIHASTGARYLYSNLYMDEDYAISLVEWEEVERDENP